MSIPIERDQMDSWIEQLEAVKLATNGNGAWPCVHANSVATRIIRELLAAIRPMAVEHEQAEPGMASNG